MPTLNSTCCVTSLSLSLAYIRSLKRTHLDLVILPHGFLAMEFKSFYSEIQDTQVDLLHQDASVRQPSALSDLLGGSTCMDVDVDSVEAELNAYSRVQQVPLETDPLMWWKQHVQEFPRLDRMARQHLAVPATSASPERLFSSVGLVKSDLRGSLLDTTLIDVMWVKQAP